MSYADLMVLPLPKKNVEAYRKIVRKVGKIWMEHGALEYREWLADDVKPGKVTSFPQAVNLKPTETVVVAWLVYKSRAQRDKVMAKVMSDPRLTDMMGPNNMPFDGKRMFFGGFSPIAAFDAD